MQTYINVYTCMHIYTYTYTRYTYEEPCARYLECESPIKECMYIWYYICRYSAYIYVCIFIYIYIYIYIYVYTYQEPYAHQLVCESFRDHGNRSACTGLWPESCSASMYVYSVCVCVCVFVGGCWHLSGIYTYMFVYICILYILYKYMNADMQAYVTHFFICTHAQIHTCTHGQIHTCTHACVHE